MTEPARQNDEQEKPANGAAEPAAPEASAAPEAAPAAPEAAPDPLAQKDAEIAQLKDQLLRALAETENTRKRAERDRDDAAKYAIGNFARDMLAVADTLMRALDSVPADAKAGNAALAILLEGVELTDRQLQSLFEKHGILRLAPMDQPFDPNLHQAMFEVPGTGKPNGTVVQVLQPGFTIHGRLLRPALVGVAKGDPKPA
ncbi:MAG: nucleotide exchange factor GrpE [Rhodospirillales bacterium]